MTKQRWGRTAGVWTLVKPEQIVAYRKEHDLSHERLGRLLGVSATTILKWETGAAVAIEELQLLLQDRLAFAPTVATARRGDTLPSDGSMQATETAGLIIAAYFKGARVELEQVGGLVRQIRAALL